VRTTVTDFGLLLLAKVLGLNATQRPSRARELDPLLTR